MGLCVAALATRPGAGSTVFGYSLAYSAATPARPVMCIDADGADGTLADVAGIGHRRSLRNVTLRAGLRGVDIERQAVAVPGRPGLRVVGGFRDCGPPAARLLEAMGSALTELPDELVVVDLGAPLAHQDLVRRHETGLAIASAFHQILIVLRLEADLLQHAVRTLSAAAVPRARLILVRPPDRRGVREARALLTENLPNYPIAGEWDWDVRRAVQVKATGRPPFREGMAEELGLFGPGVIVPSRRRSLPRLTFRTRQEGCGGD